MKKFLKPIGIVLTFLVGVLIGSFTGNVITAFILGVLLAGLSTYKNSKTYLEAYKLRGLALDSLDITALATALGSYHREHRDELASEILLDEDFTADMEVMDDVTDEVPLPDLSLTNIVQPGVDKTFNPTANAIKFAARILKVRDCKVDLLLEPWKLEKTWLGKMKKANDPLDMPFEAFIFDYINSKIKEDMRLKAIYKGVYNAAGTGPADTMHGYLKIVADEITATNIAPVVTGAITSSNVVDKIELTHDALGEAYKNGASIMKCSPTIFAWYVRKYRLDFGGNTDYAGMPKNRRRVLIDGTNCELVAEPGFGTSQRLVSSRADNFVYGVDSTSGYNVDVQKFDRQLKVLIDFKAGVQFKQIHARGLAVNDQV
jgi:hypothetical protein